MINYVTNLDIPTVNREAQPSKTKNFWRSEPLTEKLSPYMEIHKKGRHHMHKVGFHFLYFTIWLPREAHIINYPWQKTCMMAL